jgi:hypothetical protein
LLVELDKDPEEYHQLKQAPDPDTLVEWMRQNASHILDNFGKSVLPRLVNSKKLVEGLYNMKWSLVGIGSNNHSLLVSDRPLIRTGSMGDPDFLLIMPLAPRLAFFACNHVDVQRNIRNTKDKELVKRMNESQVELAVKYLYGLDSSHRAFVEDRLRPKR